jgi:hypothetical protein
VSNIRQIEKHTAEPLVPGSSHLEVEISIAKLKKYKSPGSDQILAELIQAGDEILVPVIHKLITSIWNKEELQDQWKESIIVPIHKKADKTVIIIVGYHCYQLHTKFYQISFSQGEVHTQMELLGIIRVGFNVTEGTTGAPNQQNTQFSTRRGIRIMN